MTAAVGIAAVAAVMMPSVTANWHHRAPVKCHAQESHMASGHCDQIKELRLALSISAAAVLGGSFPQTSLVGCVAIAVTKAGARNAESTKSPRCAARSTQGMPAVEIAEFQARHPSTLVALGPCLVQR